MTVYDQHTLDLVTLFRSEGRVSLGIVVPGPFLTSTRFLGALQGKIDAYVSFLQSGAIWRKFPDAEGLDPWIQIGHAGTLSAGGLAVVESIASQLGALGIGLETTRISDGE